MQAKNIVFLVGIAMFLQSCATLPKSEIETPDKKLQIAKPEITPARFLKRKVAIARFSNETKYAQSFFADSNKDSNRDSIGKQAMDILAAKLAATEKFILLERSDISKVIDEIKMGPLSNMDIKNINLLGADYMIVGSISEFGRKEISDVGIFSRTKKQIAYAKVNVRLIDVYTGHIIYSAEGEGEVDSEVSNTMGLGERAGYDSSLNDKAISAALSKLANNIVNSLLDKPWRAYLLSYEGNNYIVSGVKSQGIRKDDIFVVYKKGKRVLNPQTNMMIELPGQMIGKVKVQTLLGADSNSEVALCSAVSGDIPRDNLSELYIQEISKE